MQLRSVFPIIMAAAVLTACNSSEDVSGQDATTPPAPVLTPAPTATAAPDGTALVEGAWNISEDASGVRAAYGRTGTQPSLSLACGRGRSNVALTLPSSAAVPEAWRLDAGGEAARIDLSPTGEATSEIGAEVDQGLAIIHALAEQEQVFRLTAPDGQVFQFPTHPGIRRVIDACSQNIIEPASAPIN